DPDRNLAAHLEDRVLSAHGEELRLRVHGREPLGLQELDERGEVLLRKLEHVLRRRAREVEGQERLVELRWNARPEQRRAAAAEEVGGDELGPDPPEVDA